MKTCEEAAREYLERGWQALAVCHPSHAGVDEEHRRLCTSPGEVPLSDRWKHWQAERVTPEDIRDQWQMWPEANVAVVLGRLSGLVGVDIDGEEGFEALRLLDVELPPTATFRTERGLRLLYSVPEGVTPPTWHPAASASILGEGALSVMPPSLHESGVRYSWQRQRKPATAPAWALSPRGSPPSAPYQPQEEGGAEIPEGTRHRRLFALACALRRHGGTREEILTLLQLVNRRCRPPLAPEELEAIARSASRYRPAG